MCICTCTYVCVHIHVCTYTYIMNVCIYSQISYLNTHLYLYIWKAKATHHTIQDGSQDRGVQEIEVGTASPKGKYKLL
jgi:hypothetical protein